MVLSLSPSLFPDFFKPIGKVIDELCSSSNCCTRNGIHGNSIFLIVVGCGNNSPSYCTPNHCILLHCIQVHQKKKKIQILNC
ncbi:hypothetical protein Ahy_B08g094189 isoform C [Arachis hypogaea]|uniref:Uncharacterized protein n=1 Tax=Arachis hypogaea TaxID=3818 RepID=A0A444Y845_ARAHY|nr:hypothetical protein Ahy_B08g094189 isoform C [Arachis hypogaea]